MERLRHLLILPHKSEQESIEVRMLYDKTIRRSALEHNPAMRMHEHELVAFSRELQLLIVK